MSRGDGDRAQEIIRSFQERTGLAGERTDARAVFELGPEDHSVEVIRTLTEIDPEWSEHVALGDPGAQPAGG